MRRRVLLLTFASTALLAGAGPAAGGALSYPSAAAISGGPRFIPDATLSASKAQRLLAAPNYWGGRYTTPAGELVTIYVSDTYPQDPAIPQRWANFLGSLVHGSELGSVTAYLAPLAEVQSDCGPQALACYSPGRSLLVAPGEAPADDISAEAVVTHEYGHHVAAHRSNAPWAAVDYGTKRWASFIQVCRRTRAGELKPGAETIPNYFFNPGEGFAESYRVLNEHKAGLVETPWDVVDRSLYPSAQALALLEQDVTSPWTKATTTAYRGSVSARARVRKLAVATVLDGALRLDLRASGGVRVRLQVTTAAGTTVADRTVAAGRRATVATKICGQRSYAARVTRVRGAGSYTLTITRP
jgi:hypothetical protein